MKINNAQRKKMKYNLHYRIRKQGFHLATKRKTIYQNQNMQFSKQCIKLQTEFGYALQLEAI